MKAAAERAGEIEYRKRGWLVWGDDEEDDQSPSGCPFCGEFGCEHLLISIDESFRSADGGPLADAFNNYWGNLTEAGGDNFDEYEPWLELIEQCENFGCRDEYYRDSGPMTATNTVDLYCATAEKVSEAVKILTARWSETMR